jgi:hypothetical protein
VQRVGFIDDDTNLLEDYKIRFKRNGIEMLYTHEYKQMGEIVDWILDNNIKCMIIDYKLKPLFPFNGTELVAFINGELPDLPCVILTNYPQDSINEKMVIMNLISDRSALDATDIAPFINTIKHSIEVFDKRLNNHIDECTQLLQKKRDGSITSIEEERFVDLYRLLRAYDEVDDIPADLLKPAVEDKIDNLLGKLSKLVKDVETRG